LTLFLVSFEPNKAIKTIIKNQIDETKEIIEPTDATEPVKELVKDTSNTND
jgi:hypothetical protein